MPISARKYRLGIDLGTSSIGVAAYELKDNNEIKKLIFLDSYIFGEPVNPKTKTTANTDRRNARLIRRQVERKKKRLKKISYIAKSIGVEKKDLDTIPGDKIHELRSKAISEKLTLPELVKVFCHMVKNRGYKGDIKRADGKVGEKISKTKEMLEDTYTLGQLLYKKKLDAQESNNPWRKLNQDGTFITRDIIEDEFELIWKEQERYHKQLKGSYKITYDKMFLDFADKKEISLKDAFHSAMFYQRPIKWSLDSVGYCSLEQDEHRAACAQIDYQKYRLAINIVNLRIKKTIGSKTEERKLTKGEINKVYTFVREQFGKYNDRSKIAYSLLYKELGLKENEKFTIDRGKKDGDDGLKGISTLKTFYDLDKEGFEFINAWNELTDKSREIVMEFLANITKYSDIQDNPEDCLDKEVNRLTENIKNRESHIEPAVKFIKMLRRKEVFYNDRFLLEGGRCSYSVKALKKITTELLKGRDEQDIISSLYPTKDIEPTSALRDITEVETKNPVTDKALREFKRTIDFVTKKFGSNPSEITVELTRELKNSLAKRNFIEKQNKVSQDDRNKAIKELKENHITISGENIEKYLLWIEEDKICPYCGQNINIKDFNEKTQIDHIVPRSLGGPNIFSNKVLAHTQCNHKKGERIPYDFKFEKDIDSYLEFLKIKRKSKKKSKDGESENVSFGTHSSLINLVKNLYAKYQKEKSGYYDPKKRKWLPTQKGRKLLDKIDFLLCKPDEIKDIVGDFSNLHLNSMAWINKIVLDWCKDICPKVTPSFGSLTAYLRDRWHFNNILPNIRISEEKRLFDDSGKEINPEQWKEAFVKKDLFFTEAEALSPEFKDYLSDLTKESIPKNDSDKQRCFKDFCQDFRQEHKFNKRCDYRHHAVDAAIIGLCTLSLVKKASDHNAKWGGLYEEKDEKCNIIAEGFEVSKENGKLYNDIKNSVEEYLTNYIVWHKPDHFPSGRFFDETAYSVKEKGGVKRLVIRQDLEKILDKEEDAQKFIEKLEEIIVGETLKSYVIKQLKERVNKNGMSLKEAFIGKNENDGIFFRGNKIKKLKIFYKEKFLIKYNEDVDKCVGGIKYYQNAGYACMDFNSETGEFEKAVPIWKYANGKDEKDNGNSVRFFIGDILFDKESKEFYKVKQLKASKKSLICTLSSETNVNGHEKKSFRNIKNLIPIKNRQHMTEIKNRYGK